LPLAQRPFSVCGLFSFVAATEKQHTVPADHPVIDTVALSPIDPQLEQTLTQRLAVARIPGGQSVDSDRNLRLCAGITQLRQPNDNRGLTTRTEEKAGILDSCLMSSTVPLLGASL